LYVKLVLISVNWCYAAHTRFFVKTRKFTGSFGGHASRKP